MNNVLDLSCFRTVILKMYVKECKKKAFSIYNHTFAVFSDLLSLFFMATIWSAPLCVHMLLISNNEILTPQ